MHHAPHTGIIFFFLAAKLVLFILYINKKCYRRLQKHAFVTFFSVFCIIFVDKIAENDNLSHCQE